ncbi:ABC transporter ATP-binding protein [Nitrospina watsonii]|uniref:Murein tripeptide ABC transporter/oligopeptide ABC transporter ATP binding subunit OppD n=1 Tax=Nitrospina watsonii TaxID=1323948 RepID=A0ABN8W0K1_9BACT|nr:ABC transporter ATP-binding protein [Nitrospina watsonii]CAI2717716.1 murein tripeptide ABC transporter/oligopeptide ABC transporter ATP binding subunit OppD [Nitrospina watsonii]
MTPATPELEIRNLKVTFRTHGGEVPAVNGISYQLASGETLAVVGESGSGKTVSALSILRLIPEPPGRIVSGNVLFRGRDLLQLDAPGLRRIRGNDIGMVFQEPMTSLNPVLTVGEQIMETLRAHKSLTAGETRDQMIELLRQVDIPAPQTQWKRYPHELSGGQRQRAMIAMALSCDPSLLIADEPTTALDVLVQAQILDLLDQIKQQRQMSVLMITHDLGLVANIAQRVLIMYAGEIVESGPVRDLFRKPRHPYTLGLIQSIPRPGAKSAHQRFHEMKGNVPAPGALPGGCPFHPRCPSAQKKCETEKPMLEDIEPGHKVSCWFPND